MDDIEMMYDELITEYGYAEEDLEGCTDEEIIAIYHEVTGNF